MPFLVLLPLLATAPVAVHATMDEKAEPDGIGKAKWGMSEAEVKKLYPKIQELPAPTPAEPLPFTLTNYTLEHQSIGPLKDCTVGLRFFNHQLVDGQYNCANKDKVHDYLMKRFGQPTQINARKVITWVGRKSSVSEMGASGRFAFADTAGSQNMGMTLYTYGLRRQQQQAAAAQAQAANTPGATPEAGK